MSILLDKNTRVIVQGFTGQDRQLPRRRYERYGTNVVGGVTPARWPDPSQHAGLQHGERAPCRKPARMPQSSSFRALCGRLDHGKRPTPASGSASASQTGSVPGHEQGQALHCGATAMRTA